MHHDTPFIAIIALGFGLSYLFGMVAHFLRLSPILGYLAAGVLLGPQTTFFYDADLQLANEISEVGIMLLMFGVGLHFSIKDLQAVKNIALPGAILQIIGTIVVTMIIGYFFHYNLFQSAIFGLCVSVASTVVLLRSLEAHNALETPRGKIAIGWLIVEDLITVLILVILPTIQFISSDEPFNLSSFSTDILFTAIKIVSFVLVMFYIGRKAIPFCISRSAATGSRELFTLSVLAIALGIAYLAVEVFHISFALGAFFAGMILHESELSHRAAEDTLPLRDAFAVLFFVSVGMIFDWHILFTNIIGVLYTAFLILVIKSVIAYTLIRLMRKSNRSALTVAVSLAQIGEFSFILAGLSVNYGYITPEQKDLILAGAIISIIVNPFLFTATEKFLAFIDHRQQKNSKATKAPTATPEVTLKVEDEVEEAPGVKEEDLIHGNFSPLPLEEEQLEELIEADHAFKNEQVLLSKHIIVVGYGAVGQSIVQKLIDSNTPCSVITHSLDEFYTLNSNCIHATFGDFKDIDHFDTANIKYAKGIIFTMEKPYEVGYTVDKLFEKYPDLLNTDKFTVTAMAGYKDEIDFLNSHHVDNIISYDECAANALFSSTLPGIKTTAFSSKVGFRKSLNTKKPYFQAIGENSEDSSLDSEPTAEETNSGTEVESTKSGTVQEELLVTEPKDNNKEAPEDK